MSMPIRDLQGNVIGYQDRDGTVRDANNKKIGFIHPRKRTVHDAQNQEVGFIDSDGNVIDRYRRRVGTLRADGTVQDWHGIEVYHGSPAPLLLDFEKKSLEPLPSRFDFDQMARQASGKQKARAPLTALPEGFVSPSVIGCLGILAALAVGVVIMFILQNPSLLSRAQATPPLSALANETLEAVESTPVANAAPAQTATPQPLIGKVNTQILNLREGPGTNFEIVDRLPQETIVILVGRLSDTLWLRVKVPLIDKEGWVAAEYIDTQVDLATLPVAESPAQ